MVDREGKGNWCMDPMKSLPFCSPKVITVQTTAGYSMYRVGLISIASGVWVPVQGFKGLITEPCIWEWWARFVTATWGIAGVKAPKATARNKIARSRTLISTSVSRRIKSLGCACFLLVF